MWTRECFNLVSCRPDDLGVVAGGGAEGEGLDVLVPEERHLVVPVCHRGHPIVSRGFQGLLVNVEVLSYSEPDEENI